MSKGSSSQCCRSQNGDAHIVPVNVWLHVKKTGTAPLLWCQNMDVWHCMSIFKCFYTLLIMCCFSVPLIDMIFISTEFKTWLLDTNFRVSFLEPVPFSHLINKDDRFRSGKIQMVTFTDLKCIKLFSCLYIHTLLLLWKGERIKTFIAIQWV